ncbi:uncharacterized protein TrAFT101_002336 [Trichoderma asperellum]|uniref:uncharacterized protein n=1 Tax=Trichoderma asperellum TaxID=101201 RepID=UPI00333107BB|nr:hypothetical protein TrAFT101_002336 [Trichoderma asperellum]
MPRKGSQKVKTGCLTCKIRKIKCDEAKPHCLRCTSTQRICDGYAPEAYRTHSWDELLSSNAIIPSPSNGRSNREGRAIDFFLHVAAPNLSNYPDKEFWTRLVPMACQQEPAVRHAAIAISSIYEQLRDGRSDALDYPGGRFALSHYHQALSHLTRKSNSEFTMLFLCILFVCIETLQKNVPAAIEHCRHGITILNNATMTPWVREKLTPMFVRLSIFPFFFGSTVTTFPSLSDLVTGATAPYTTLEESLSALELLQARSVRFIRSSDTYRQGIMYRVEFPNNLHQEQSAILAALGQWLHDFSIFREAYPPTSHDAKAPYLGTLIKGLVCKIWVGGVLDKTEMGYDNQLASFKAVVDAAEKIISLLPPAQTLYSKSKFTFGMGYMPPLYLVVIKCRNLNIRRAALKAMVSLATCQENLWDLSVMSATGRRVIELEHGINLETFDREDLPDAHVFVPPDEMRIRDSIITKSRETQIDASKQSTRYMLVSFLFATLAGFSFVDEWLPIGPVPTSST